ncbi:MAG: polyamine aminopropyltransferase [Treponema sp.]|nr:polyamine aminopropyltransferase [Treponema sp.]
MEVRENVNASSGFFYKVKNNLASKQTQFQKAELVETESFGKAMLLDGRTQVTERWEYRYHEPLVHPVMLLHPNPRRVLLIGGGDGGTLREILKYKSIEAVDFAELDPDVVAFSKEHFPSIHGGSFSDPRLTFHYGDGRAFVEKSSGGYDVIIMDMTDPIGPSSALYTAEFFTAVKKLFRDADSLFSMHGESPMAWPEAFACIGATLTEAFKHISTATCYVPMYGTLWSFRYAGDSAVPRVNDSELIEKRQTERLAKKLTLVNKSMWHALFAEDPVIAEAEANPARKVIRDADAAFPAVFGAQPEN